MIRPKIHGFHSPDIADLETFSPASPDNFGYLLLMLIGPQDGKGAEQFELLVSTPRWLESEYNEAEVLLGRHRLIVFQYNWRNVENAVSKAVARCVGETWGDVAKRIGAFAKWEFED